jgi:hypothetical protein
MYARWDYRSSRELINTLRKDPAYAASPDTRVASLLRDLDNAERERR